MLLRCAVSTHHLSGSSRSLILPLDGAPIRPTSIRSQSLIAVTELCLYAVYDTASLTSDKGRIEVTCASV